MKLLTLTLVGLVLGASGRVSAQESKPLNVVLIMADDSAADNYGCYGSSFFKTPRLDALARNGARFRQCYSEPVCTPSRVKIMTGRDGIRNYVAFGTLDRDEITFGTMMKNAGYATAIAGKWQLHGGERGSLAPECGFDNYCLWNYPGTSRPRYWNPSIVQDGKLLATTVNDYGPDIFTEYLIDFIAKNKAGPFFAYYPMVLVHSPFVKTPDSKASQEGIPTRLKNFRDMTLYADKCVGKIIDALDEHGLRENTVVIYTTDNGSGRSLRYPFGDEQRKGEKAYATDGGTHAPMIVSCPGTVPGGIVSDDLIDFSDVLPTIAAITGALLPKVELDGRSFWPQCRGEKGNPRPWIFQYYYPKFAKAAENHGQGVRNLEIVWAQNQQYKLYRDGSLYAVKDRHETALIKSGADEAADSAHKLLQAALDSMPQKAAKLAPGPAGIMVDAGTEIDEQELAVFERELGDLVAQLRLPALAVGVVRDDELWFRGFGFADRETESPVTRDTPFHLASLTKTFASTVLLHLVEEGLLDLDERVADLGIDLRISGTRLDAPDAVTVRHLLSHTAEGTPGESYRYNGSLFSALSLVIEVVADRPFIDVLRGLVIEPLHLENTGRSTDPTRIPLATPYQVDESGELQVGQYPGSFSVSAGMVSSVADLAAYSAAIDNHQFVSAKSQNLAFSPAVSTRGHKLPYGLGWFVEDYDDTRLIWHYGYWTCISTLIIKVPEKKLTFIALANTDHLSRGFGLGAGSVLKSPMAQAFLRRFVSGH